MRLRLILSLLSLLAFLSALAGGYFYYSSVRTAFFDAAEQEAVAHASTARSLISQHIMDIQRVGKVLSGLWEIQAALMDPDAEALARANRILDRFQQGAGVEVCYLMDREGRTIASSNRFDTDSFVGKNYAFRPYFQEAMSGKSSAYLAMGVTSNRRGIYFGHPVFGADPSLPIGVAVVKGSAEGVVERFKESIRPAHALHEGLLFLVDPLGVIFISDVEGFLLKTLWQTDELQRQKIAETRQFGGGPWVWSGFTRLDGGHVMDHSGNRFRMVEESIMEELPGWRVVHLSNTEAVASLIANPLLKTIAHLVIGLCVLIGAAVFFLNNLAHAEILRRKQVEAALRESEGRLRTIVEHSNELFYIHDTEHRLTYVSPGSRELLGYSPDEMLVKWPKLTTDNPINQKGLEITEKALRTGERQPPYLLELRRKDGGAVFLEIDESPIRDEMGRIIGMAGAARDVTRKIQGEKALKESEERYRILVEESFDGVFVQKGPKIIFANSRLHRMLGYEEGELLGRDHGIIYYGESQELARNRAQARMRGEQPPSHYEVKLGRKDGSWFYGEIAARAIQFDEGPGIQVWVKDIHERKVAEQTLRESEVKYRTILENIEDGYYEVDLSGNITFFNDSLCRILGYASEELLGLNYQRLTTKENAREVYRVFNRIFVSGKADRGFDWEVLRKDGTTRHVEASVSRRLGEDGKPIGFRGIVRDVSEKKRLEAQLQRAQKMEAIGTLAGGVAHDLNNILSGLVSYPELLLMQIPEDSPLRKPLQTIQRSGERAAAVVQDLLTLARRGVSVTEVVNLNEVIDQYLKSPEHERLRSFHPGVAVKTHLDPGLLNVSGSPVHLAKTVMNLVSNAAEAVREGGEVVISTENRYIDRPVRGYEDVLEGDYVVLTVADTGIGISPEDIKKIFEPFYTKKKMGRSGTGLGMSVVYGAVKDHHGYIDVESREGKGTTFTLYFPATRQVKGADSPRMTVDHYRGRGESILIVDDVEQQREIAAEMLKGLGYSVATVASGEEAVAYVKAHSVDLIVLDMIMDPGMDGLDAYREIIRVRPGQKAIIASGFSETDRVREAQRLGVGAYVRKPFLSDKIGPAIRAELDRSSLLL